MDSSLGELFEDEKAMEPAHVREISSFDLNAPSDLKGSLLKKGGSKGGKGHAWKERWFVEVIVCGLSRYNMLWFVFCQVHCEHDENVLLQK